MIEDHLISGIIPKNQGKGGVGKKPGLFSARLSENPESDEEEGSLLRSDANQSESGKIERSAEALQVFNLYNPHSILLKSNNCCEK